jgi:excisionase family DNA binding protein
MRHMAKPRIQSSGLNPQLYDTEEAAAALGIHPESVRRMVRQGRINAVKIGPLWRIPAAEIANIQAQGVPLLNA